MRHKIFLAACFAALPGAAFAHVTLTPASAAAGSTIVAQLRVGHGCGDVGTNALTVGLPAGLRAAEPQAKPGWTILQTAAAMTWRGGSLPAHEAGIFEIRLTLPTAPGALYFPVTQTCENTAEHWSDIPDGKNGTPLRHPAPLLTVVAAGRTPAATPNLVVGDAWIRALPASVPSGGYFTLHNAGDKAVTLTGASSAACGMLMLHQSENMGGMSGMEDVAQVDVPPGGTIKFAPGGYHLMCMNPTKAVTPGGKIALTLEFQGGGKLVWSFDVRDARGK